MGRDNERRWFHHAAAQFAKHLLHLAFDLRLLVTYVWDDVAEDIERSNSWISGAGYCLHGGREHGAHAKALVQRCERNGCDRCRAVGVRDDRSLPAARFPLHGDQAEVRRVDLRNHQRNVVFHAKVLRIAQHEAARAGEEWLELAGGLRIERGEDDRRGHTLRVARQDVESGNRGRHLAFDPSCRLGVALPRGALARGNLGHAKPGMAIKQADECLAHGTGGAEDRDWSA